MRKNAFALFLLLAPCLAMAQAIGGPSPMALHVPDSIGYVVGNHVYVNQPDHLDLLIEANRLDTATALAVHGPVSGEDLRYLRLLCGGEYISRAMRVVLEGTDTTLNSIDLSDARFSATHKNGYCIDGGADSFRYYRWKKYIQADADSLFPPHAFYECRALRKIQLPSGIKELSDYSFEGTAIDSLVVPEGVHTLNYCINYCPRLKYVCLPSTLKNVHNPFWGDENVEEIVCRAETPPAFEPDGGEDFVSGGLSFHDHCKLVVPQGCAALYREADVWKLFTNIVEEGAGQEETMSPESPDAHAPTNPAPGVKSVPSLGEDPSTWEGWEKDIRSVAPDCLDVILPALGLDTLQYMNISASLSGEDVRLLRIKAGGYYKSYKPDALQDTTLHVLDLSRSDFAPGYGAYLVPTYGDASDPLKLYIGERDVLARYMFRDCRSLRRLVLPACLRRVDHGSLQNLTGIDSLAIPDSVEAMADALMGCSRLRWLSLPASLQRFGCHNFDSCAALRTVVCAAAMPPAVTGGGFDAVVRTCTLVVPPGTRDVYAHAPGWQDFLHITEQDLTAIAAPQTGMGDGADTEWYTLGGYRVSHPHRGSVTIVKTGRETRKVLQGR